MSCSIERNDVPAADIEKTLRIQESVGGRLGALLVRTGAISEDLLMRRLAEQQGALYLRSTEDLPDSLDVYQFMSESPIKLDWFLDNAVLMWRQEEACSSAWPATSRTTRYSRPWSTSIPASR